MRHFKLSEFDCKCGCGTNKMDSAFLDTMDSLREAYGKPIKITSGYRCPAHNLAVSSTGPDGPHTSGKAADIGISGPDVPRLLRIAMNCGGFSGFGLNQKGASRFLHLDSLTLADGFPRPALWTY